MKDEISKRFDEQFKHLQDAFYKREDFKAFLNSELERQEREIRKQTNIVLGDKCDEMERLLTEQERVLRELIIFQADKYQNALKMLEEQEKCLRLNVDEVKETIRIKSHYKITIADSEYLATAICALKDKIEKTG